MEYFEELMIVLAYVLIVVSINVFNEVRTPKGVIDAVKLLMLPYQIYSIIFKPQNLK